MKQILALSIIVLAGALSAMEIPQNICFLAHLPNDLQNIIGEYLIGPEETDEELIERNHALGWGSDYHRKAQNYMRINGTFSGDSWDYSWQVYYDRCSRNKTQLLIKNKDVGIWLPYIELARRIYDDEEYPQIVDITISSDGALIAKMAQKKIEESWVVTECGWGAAGTFSQAKISVYQLANGGKKEFIIPTQLKKVFFVGMNKQNTKIITHISEEGRGCKPFIFSFKKEYEKTNNRLNDYFKQNRVCKKLASSLPQISQGNKKDSYES